MDAEEPAEPSPGAATAGPAGPVQLGAGVGERGRFRRRRRPNATLEERSVVQKVKLTGSEQQRLRDRAADAGVTVPRLLVESAFSDHAGTGELRSIGLRLLSVHTDLSRAAGNMNQVAKKANTVHEIPSDFRSAMAELRRVAEQVEQVTGEIAASLRGPSMSLETGPNSGPNSGPRGGLGGGAGGALQEGAGDSAGDVDEGGRPG